MESVRQRFKRVVGSLLTGIMIISMVLPAYASPADVGMLRTIEGSNLHYSATTFDKESPFVTKDGSLALRITGGSSSYYADTSSEGDPDTMGAYENFYYALRLSMIVMEAKAAGRNISWVDSSEYGSDADASDKLYNDACGTYSYNPYSPRYAHLNYGSDGSTVAASADLAEMEFDKYISDLKSVDWVEWNDAIDAVVTAEKDDALALYDANNASPVFCYFIEALWAKLKSDGIINNREPAYGKYAIEEFTYDRDIISSNGVGYYGNYYELDPVTHMPVQDPDTGEYIYERRFYPYADDDDFLQPDGFVSTLGDTGGSDSRPEYSYRKDLGYSSFNHYTGDTSSRNIKTFPFFGKVVYSSGTTIDRVNSEYILFDFVETWLLTVPTTTDYVNKEVVTNIEVGDILAPGAVILHGYDTDANKFYLARAYGNESGTEVYHATSTYCYSDTYYMSSACGAFGYYNGARSSYYSFSDLSFTDDVTDLPRSSEVRWGITNTDLPSIFRTNSSGVYSYYSSNYYWLSFNKRSYDYDKGILKYSGSATCTSSPYGGRKVNYDVILHLSPVYATEADYNAGIYDSKRVSSYEVKMYMDQPIDLFKVYSQSMTEKSRYISYLTQSVPTAPSTFLDQSSAFLNSTLSCYASRMPLEEDVKGYEVIGKEEKEETFNTATDIVVYLKVKPLRVESSHTVIFVTNGDTQIEPQTVADGGFATKPDNPSKTGHAFDKWYSDEDLQTEYDFETPVTEDLTLYGSWTKEQYTVSFNSLGGSEVDPQTVSYNEVVIRPEDPTYEGRDFVNWFPTERATEAYDFRTPVTGNMTLFGRWDLKDCTVTFNPVGGSPVPSQTVKYGEKIVRPDDSIKTGHHIEHWRVGSTTGEIYDFDTPVTGNITLFADWGKNNYTVTVNKDDGIASVTGGGVYAYGDPVTLGYTLEAGYAFNGWSGDESTNEFIMPANDVTMTAHAVTMKYHVLYDGNGADYGAMEAQEKAHGIPIILKRNEFTREGYQFMGWNTRSDGHGQGYEEGAEYNGNGEVIMYAQWNKLENLKYQKKLFNDSEYNFNWNDDLGTLKNVLHEDKDDQYANTNDKWTATMTIDSLDYDTAVAGFEEALPPKSSYPASFAVDIVVDKYISVDSDLTDIVDHSNFAETSKPMSISLDASTIAPEGCSVTVCNVYRIHKNVVSKIDSTLNRDTSLVTFESDNFSTYLMYFGWGCNVQFESNGGTFVPDQEVEHGQRAEKPANPTKNGYGFAGWYSDVDLLELYDFNEPVTSDIVLYAKWFPLYSVSFNTNGGTPVPATQSVKSGDKASVPDDPTKVGSIFGGWYSDEVLTEVYDFDDPVITDIVLYAKWLSVCSVSFDADGGTPVPDTQSVVYGNTATKPVKAPSKSGYVFVNWYLDNAVYDFSKPVTSDITLVAKYRNADVYYVVTFDSNGGDRTPAGQRVIAGGKVTRPFNPSKDDYTFEYWDYAGSKYDFNQPVYTDMVLTAVYKKKDDKKKDEDKKSDSTVYQTPYQAPVMFMPGTGSVMVPSGTGGQSTSMMYDTVQTGVAPIDFHDLFTKD